MTLSVAKIVALNNRIVRAVKFLRNPLSDFSEVKYKDWRF
jgi:hypothetical protein